MLFWMNIIIIPLSRRRGKGKKESQVSPDPEVDKNRVTGMDSKAEISNKSSSLLLRTKPNTHTIYKLSVCISGLLYRYSVGKVPKGRRAVSRERLKRENGMAMATGHRARVGTLIDQAHYPDFWIFPYHPITLFHALET
jgi:hypothetical protein